MLSVLQYGLPWAPCVARNYAGERGDRAACSSARLVRRDCASCRRGRYGDPHRGRLEQGARWPDFGRRTVASGEVMEPRETLKCDEHHWQNVTFGMDCHQSG